MIYIVTMLLFFSAGIASLMIIYMKKEQVVVIMIIYMKKEQVVVINFWIQQRFAAREGGRESVQELRGCRKVRFKQGNGLKMAYNEN